MGIDARILLILKDNDRISEKECLHSAYMLASTIGHNKFFINETHHALEIIKPEEFDKENRIKIVYNQDGDVIIAAENEQFLKINLLSRYYGPDYERGCWQTIRTILEWLRFNFPNGKVMYGGDSSGVCAEEVTSEFIKEMDELFYKTGRHNYTHNKWWNSFLEGSVICPRCQEITMNKGGGRNKTFHHCSGCGAQFVARGNDVFMEKYSHNQKDIFKLSTQVDNNEISPTFKLK